jgi:NAD(P)-dependent dehydrogenase (short-subunit alcohol dehydrogenase family)
MCPPGAVDNKTRNLWIVCGGAARLTPPRTASILATMTVRFDGRVVLVTGAGRGLGAAHAALLAELGGVVIVNDAGLGLGGDGGDRALADGVVERISAAGGSAVASYEDLSVDGACERVVKSAIDRFGRIDAIVNNAGLLAWKTIEETDDELLRRMIKVSVEAPLKLSRAAWPAMKRQRYGRIVMTVSGRAMYVDASVPGLSAYSIGKGGQLGLMVALAAEGDSLGIRINAISPVAATRMYHGQAEPGELIPEQVSPGVALLASDCCDVSGIVLRAAGGRFSVARWQFGDDIDFGNEPASPDDLERLWPDLLTAQARPAR